MFHFYWNFAAFIILLSILIVVHELGHFFVARIFRVKVEKFSIGLGPKIFSWRNQQNTNFIISAIPIGGYVKMLDHHIDPEAFNNKKIWQRAAIITAGPVCNIILAIIAYWIVFMIGIPSYPPIISKINPNSIVAQAKIKPFMEIKSINNVPTPNWNSVRLQLIQNIDKQKISIGIAPFNSEKINNKVINLNNFNYKQNNKDDILLALGIIPSDMRIEPVIAIEPIIDDITSGTAADKAGLKVGDKIIKVDDKIVVDWQNFIMKVRDNPGNKLTVIIDRKDKIMEVILTPEKKLLNNNKVQGFAGIIPKTIFLPKKYTQLLSSGPLNALNQAINQTNKFMTLTISIFSKLISGDIRFNNFHGPIYIAKSAGRSAEYGLIYYLIFLAFISLNVSIINLFPLPILDGGNLLFLLIEKLKGRPVSPKVQEFSYNISAMILIVLMILAIFNDIARLC
ncbi:sigma E protease regulator RseP [Candidatus Palibaumannia cicadellinicola]|uniref:Zinc metalloprotease n=1 Tax=Candidatus Palibaumannia cicadellinicola TaxID=186490 RepID=A0A0K2BL14_9GAMM|nr:sigma E protease regulator RseP [Candidatus Baumannia cicadellinicola]AKZ66066.1 Membrane-associated zinc metalloprotease [Candidatus Baumannia cicadellinicola]